MNIHNYDRFYNDLKQSVTNGYSKLGGEIRRNKVRIYLKEIRGGLLPIFEGEMHTDTQCQLKGQFIMNLGLKIFGAIVIFTFFSLFICMLFAPEELFSFNKYIFLLITISMPLLFLSFLYAIYMLFVKKIIKELRAINEK